MYLIPGCVGRGVRLGSESSSGGGAGGGVWKSGNLEIWGPGNLEILKYVDLEIQKLGVQTIPKITILKIKIRVSQNVRKVWISRKKTSWPHFMPFQAVFLRGPEKSKKNTCVSSISAIYPLWGPCCYPSLVGMYVF